MRTTALVLLLLAFPLLGEAEVTLRYDAISSGAISCGSGETRVSGTLGGYAFGTYGAPSTVVYEGFWFPRFDPTADVEEAGGIFPFRLDQNVPNPFALQTSIGYAVPGPSDGPRPTRLEIFDPQGRRVVTLVNAPLAPGRYRAQWPGRDFRGHPVAAGVYYCRLQVGERTSRKVLVLLK